jgi:hypothetical protein
MSRGDPTTLGGLARLAMLSRVWKHGPPVGDDAARAFYFLRPRVPMAAALLSRAAIGALTRPVPPGGCSWCTARLLSGASLGAWEPPTDDDLYRAFLGASAAAAGWRSTPRGSPNANASTWTRSSPPASPRPLPAGSAAPNRSRPRWPPSAVSNRPGRPEVGRRRPGSSGRPARGSGADDG